MAHASAGNCRQRIEITLPPRLRLNHRQHLRLQSLLLNGAGRKADPVCKTPNLVLVGNLNLVRLRTDPRRLLADQREDAKS
jgi:hypothetical protein